MFFGGSMPENGIFYPSASVLQSLHTSTHPSNFEYCSSSGIVNSMALFALPAAFGARAAFFAEPVSDVLGPQPEKRSQSA